jgi:hypothetical protein
MATKLAPRTQLIVAIAMLLFLWGVVFPKLSQTETARQWIDPLRAQGIDPSALYYTEVFNEPSER